MFFLALFLFLVIKKALKNIFTLLFVIIITPNFFSQEVSFLKGKILSDSLEVSGITITNKRLKLSNKTNEAGKFEIPVSLEDSI